MGLKIMGNSLEYGGEWDPKNINLEGMSKSAIIPKKVANFQEDPKSQHPQQ